MNIFNGLLASAAVSPRASAKPPGADVFYAALVVSKKPAVAERWRRVLNLVAPRRPVAVTQDSAQARDFLSALPYDFVLVDIEWACYESIQFIAHARRRNPDAEIIAVASAIDRAPMSAAIIAGATGCLLTDADDNELARMLRSIKRGGAPIDSRVARRLLDSIAALAKQARGTVNPRAKLSVGTAVSLIQRNSSYASLSPAEIRVLRLIARGWTNRQIAEAVYSSIHTVATHTKNIYRKLSVKSRTQAVHQATQYGLLDGSQEHANSGSARSESVDL
jgi:DNA-binding NarL/FixJ family response regulator